MVANTYGRYLLPILRICYSRKYGGVGICYKRWVFATVANMEGKYLQPNVRN